MEVTAVQLGTKLSISLEVPFLPPYILYFNKVGVTNSLEELFSNLPTAASKSLNL